MSFAADCQYIPDNLTTSSSKPVGFAQDIENFIKDLPTIQYSPSELAKLAGKPFFGFIKHVAGDFCSSANKQMFMKAGLSACNIISSIARRTGNHDAAAISDFVQNCISLKSLADTVNGHVRYIWGKKELILFTMKPIFPQLRDFDIMSVRGDNSCSRYDRLNSVSDIEHDALTNFCNGDAPVTFFSSFDKQNHTVVPVGTTIENIYARPYGMNKEVWATLATEYAASNQFAYLFLMDSSVVIVKCITSGTPSDNGGKVCCQLIDSVEVLTLSHTKLPDNHAAILNEFIANLFVQFIDSKQYVYTLKPMSTVLAKEARPTILPSKFISEPVEKAIASMENMFARELSRCYAFVGYPGTGKTIITKQISNHFSQYCTFILPANMIEDYEAVSNLITYVKAVKKCIIIVDDMDSCDLSEKNDSVNAYIGLFDKLNTATKNDGVSYMFLTTINDPSKVNMTIMKRSGRIDETIDVGYPKPEVVDYLVEYNDVNINKKSTTDFKAPEFTDVMNELYEAKLSAADVTNIFNYMTISPEFDGKYTPEMLRKGLEVVRFRNKTSKENFMD